MPSDSSVRLLLVLIAACLLVLVVRSFEHPSVPGRYQLSSLRAGTPLLIRADTVTGKVWKLELRGGRDRWVAFREPGEAGEEPAAEAEAPARDSASADPGERASARHETPAPPAPPASAAAAAAPPARPAVPAPIDQDVGKLRQAISDPELPLDIRVWAAQRLASMDDPKASQALIEALGDPNAELAFGAVEDKLAESTNPQVREAVEKLRAARSREKAAGQKSGAGQ